MLLSDKLYELMLEAKKLESENQELKDKTIRREENGTSTKWYARNKSLGEFYNSSSVDYYILGYFKME